MIEVFKTNVCEPEEAKKLVDLLQQHFPCCKINFDLDDCDKVLRIEGNDFVSGNVIRVLIKRGFMCNLLE